LPCALALAALLLPPFNALTGVEVAFAWTTNGGLLLALVVATLVVGLLAGSYPALALSCYRPLQVLRGQLETGARGRRVRQVLVVTQFALTAALLFATGMVMRQLEYIQTRDLGFATERVVAFDLAGDASRAAALRAALGQHPEVQHVAFATGVPGTRLGFFGTSYDNFERDGERIRLGNAYVDTAFAETVGLTRVAGRFVRAGDEPADPEASQPSEAVVLNETAAERLGWVPAAEAVGETFSYYEGDMRIVGVVEDFHFRSLHHRIEPLMLHYRPAARHGMAVVRLRADVPLGDALDRLEAAWGRVMPHLPFEPRFADDAIEAQYRAEERAATLVAAFAVVAVVLACLGLVGLATYAAARRTKEISVRKVLGASATQIVVLLGRQFAALVAVALVVGAPVALYGVTRWLEGFAYRAPLSPLTFAGAAGLVLAIALLSVGVQTLRAARTDPAEALRAE
jgi:putative ABC transport system permease protein